MVLYEKDGTDRQVNFEELYSYLPESKITLYNNRVLHINGATYQKKTRRYFMDTVKGENLIVKANEIMVIEEL